MRSSLQIKIYLVTYFFVGYLLTCVQCYFIYKLGQNLQSLTLRKKKNYKHYIMEQRR